MTSPRKIRLIVDGPIGPSDVIMPRAPFDLLSENAYDSQEIP
ncbi:MAG: hypothetical protein ABSA11_01080 [Candidatus Bathyarchaeia archaeon]